MAGGVVAVDAAGNVCLCYNSAGMYRAAIGQNRPLFVGIFEDNIALL